MQVMRQFNELNEIRWEIMKWVKRRYNWNLSNVEYEWRQKELRVDQ